MDKNKQKKKRKFKTKLISISMLAIILVVMLAVPTSAVYDENELLGTWVLNDTLERVESNMWIPSIDGVGHWVTRDGTIQEFHIYRIRIYSSNFTFYIAGDENSVYPSVACLDNNVTIYPYNYPTDFDYYDIRVGEVGYTEARTFTINAINSEGDAEAMLEYLKRNATKVIPPTPEPDPLGNILDVFLGIGGWIATAVTSLIGIFYSAEAGMLTVIGVLSVASLAISVIFLLIGVIQNFMHFRS